MEYILLGVVAIVLIVVFLLQKSPFINQMYRPDCMSNSVKPFPSGNVPGVYSRITPAERQNLLVDFITDNPNI
jgi:hypothetical protein